jgi:hypothetical protein
MGSDAEYMYENDLDPLYRKDKATGELVEWEGGLNPAYKDDGDLYGPYDGSDDEDLVDVITFNTFGDAVAWSKKNPGRSFTKNPEGNGYVVKDSTSGSSTYNVKTKNIDQYGNIRPSVYKEISKKKYFTREQSEAQNNFRIDSMRVTPELAKKIQIYINNNDLRISSYTRKIYPDHDRQMFGVDICHFVKHISSKDFSNNKNSICKSSYTPCFSLKMYFKPDGDCFMCLICYAHSYSKEISEKYILKVNRCKTILDLYFDILNKYPNDLISISFDYQPMGYSRGDKYKKHIGQNYTFDKPR